jgi:FkbM family methyltransferase
MDKRVDVLTPSGEAWFTVTGSATDAGVLGGIERRGGYYEPRLVSLLTRLVHPSDVCLDIGANIGVVSLILADLAPAGSVFAFEPGAGNLRYLERNVLDNHGRNITIEPVGLYDKPGTLRLHVDAAHPGGAHIAGTEVRGEASEEITVVALDDWIGASGLERLDVIKMDIEGAELRALDGAHSVLSRFRPLLIIECNPITLARFQDARPEELFARLRAIYPKIYFDDDGPIRELVSDAHASSVLERCGVIDLVCGDRVAALAERPVVTRARRLLQRARRRLRRGPPSVNFVQSPSYHARFGINRLVATRSTTVVLPVVLHNTSRFWLSSTFDGHPVSASYRWRRHDGVVLDANGMRSFFPSPVPPGGKTTVDLFVALPDDHGEYVLQFALVQEGYAWFDDLERGLSFPLPVSVR